MMKLEYTFKTLSSEVIKSVHMMCCVHGCERNGMNVVAVEFWAQDDCAMWHYSFAMAEKVYEFGFNN